MKSMKIIKLSILCLIISINGFSQLTYMPDDNFEAWVEMTSTAANNGIANDNYVLTAGLTASSVTFGGILNITDFTGLQDYPFLTGLNFNNQNLTVIDLSNIPLHHGVASNWNLTINSCAFLTSIIMPHNDLNFSIASCPYLTNIVFQNDNILYGVGLPPTVSGCNSLTTFDISNISDVTLGSKLYLSNNLNLNCVNLKNGLCNKWGEVLFLSNSSLFCVEVDNPTFCLNAEAINTWQWIDLMANPSICQYSTNCGCVASIDEEITDEVSISPNPTTSKIRVKSNAEFIGKEFLIYDQLGKEVKSGIITSENTEIDLSNLTEGMYLFKIGAEMPDTFKIIKQ